ncbi:hypothetical protein QBC44DRAFT_326410 [Cladorrhinum sp. PSN332]|nr:hypothetical protein QBC44DRAFT_326410 [Cladorrhinum sp. PSN332]
MLLLFPHFINLVLTRKAALFQQKEKKRKNLHPPTPAKTQPKMANHYPHHDPIPVQDQAAVGMEVFRGLPNQPPIPLSPYTKPPETPYKYHYEPPFERDAPPQQPQHHDQPLHHQHQHQHQHLQQTLSQRPESETDKELLPKHNRSEPREKRILGIRISILLFIITGLLVLVIAALALVGGLLASKIASIESAVSAPITANNNSSTGTGTNSAAAAVTTDIEVPNYRYVGCYVDDLERVLSRIEKTDTKLTNQGCAGFCVGNKYFGTEAGTSCYCGQTIPVRAVKANEWNCNTQCEGRKGSKAEVCGGAFYISIWEREA